jgi:aerobic carbon-monoxide dehydrogenase small subunit
MTLALQEIFLTVNGKAKTVHTHPMERLLDVLRQQLNLTGAKEGCGEGECGSCSVIMDGVLVNSCLIPILQAQGSHIVTVEGLAPEASLLQLQQSFLEGGGAQCGICTPGILMAATHLLRKHPHPTSAQIAEWLSGNLCRCTGYAQICESIAEAANSKRSEGSN